MKNFSTWLLLIFMVMFFLLRAVICVCAELSVNILGIISYNLSIEIIMLFITILCILLVAKRNIIGALIYFLMYGTYFGEHLLSNIGIIINGSGGLTMDLTLNLLIDFCAILLALFVIFDMLLDKGRKANPIDKKTDWYYKNEEYDRKLNARDDRDDKNQYKFY